MWDVGDMSVVTLTSVCMCASVCVGRLHVSACVGVRVLMVSVPT